LVRPTQQTILFIESGETGGGSFESLFQHLRVIDRNAFRPVVVCLNDVPHVQRIRDLGITVIVLTDPLFSLHVPGWKRWLPRKLRRVGIRLSRLLPALFPLILRIIHAPTITAITRIAEQEHAALVHLNVQPYRDYFGIVAAARAGVPLISHLRSADPGTRGQFNPVMARYANAKVDSYIANSAMTANYWLREGLEPTKVRIVLNGIEDRQITPADVRKRWGIDADANVIGVIAPLRNPLKVDEFTIRVFARFLERYPQATLLIVGDGPMDAILAREAARLGISAQVILAGFQKDAKEIIAGVDASLILSKHDSFSRVAIESLQVGSPLVATDIGGIRELIEDRVNGMLVPYGDEVAVANVLDELQRDESLRMRLVENGRYSVKKRFSAEQYSEVVAAIYAETISTGSTARGNERK
jgi:glycosyltransferase involved in cell wall biosynthesis